MSRAKPQIFMKHDESGEGTFHCGATADEVCQSLVTYLRPEIEEMLVRGQDTDRITILLTRHAMTAAEVAALPEG